MRIPSRPDQPAIQARMLPGNTDYTRRSAPLISPKGNRTRRDGLNYVKRMHLALS
jgi:hypothetical protein